LTSERLAGAKLTKDTISSGFRVSMTSAYTTRLGVLPHLDKNANTETRGFYDCNGTWALEKPAAYQAWRQCEAHY
jgi:hypothetical protein